MDDIITVRDMLPTDIELVYQWRNDPRVRQFMFNTAPLKWPANLRDQPRLWHQSVRVWFGLTWAQAKDFRCAK